MCLKPLHLMFDVRRNQGVLVRKNLTVRSPNHIDMVMCPIYCLDRLVCLVFLSFQKCQLIDGKKDLFQLVFD